MAKYMTPAQEKKALKEAQNAVIDRAKARVAAKNKTAPKQVKQEMPKKKSKLVGVVEKFMGNLQSVRNKTIKSALKKSGV